MLSRRDLYNRYNDTLRPLVSEIEGRNESFEEPLLINVASMFDSIALADSLDADDKEHMMQKARAFLDLSISQSYQFLIRNLNEKVLAFEKRCNASDRQLLDEGRFVGRYRELKKKGRNCVHLGVKKDDILALSDYACAYDCYSRIEKMIDKELPVQIMQHTRKASFAWTAAGWITGIVISVVIGKIVSVYSTDILNWVATWKNV